MAGQPKTRGRRRQKAQAAAAAAATGPVRKPGQDFEGLTDDEILSISPKFLTPQQRQRRRKLKRSGYKTPLARAREERKAAGVGTQNYCSGYKKRTGQPCGGYAVLGTRHCYAHLDDADKAKLGISEGLQEAGRRVIRERASKLSGPQMATRVFEQALEKVFVRYFAAIGMEFKGFDANNDPIIVDNGIEDGLRLFASSKDGNIVMSEHPDLLNQIMVMERMWDRIYGKPRQTQVIEGGKTAVKIQPVRSADRAQHVASLLQRSGALPHEGRRRPSPSELSGEEQSNTSDGSSRTPDGSVIPLRPKDGS